MYLPCALYHDVFSQKLAHHSILYTFLWVGSGISPSLLELHAGLECAGLLHEAQGQLEEASVCYKNALAVNASHVDSKVKLGALLLQQGGRASLPVARSYVAEALQAEPTHEGAWYQMGLLHKEEDCPREAANCFQAALMLEESSPVEKFSSLSRALLWGL